MSSMEKNESKDNGSQEKEPLKGSEQEDDGSALLPIPPDGGWGWVVVFASFIIHIIADGVAYSFGIFLNSFIDHFETGRGETGWLGSLMIGVTWGSGPVASALTNKFGCRVVTIMGSVLSCVGFVVSIFAPNIWFMYFSFGIVSGLGLGLIYLPAIVSVTFYFEKKRSFATGLAVCGSGIGTFIFAPLVRALLDSYGWKGAVLIEAGLLLNCIVFGALFRPLALPKNRKYKEESEEMLDMAKESQSETNNVNDLTVANSEGGDIPRNSSEGLRRQKVSSESEPREDNNERTFAGDLCAHQSSESLTLTQRKKPVPKDIGPLARKDIFYNRSLNNIPLYNSNPALYTASIVSLAGSSKNEDGENSAKAKKCWDCSDLSHTCCNIMDLALLKDPIFILYSLSNLFACLGYCVPYIYLPDRAKQLGISDSQAAFLISVIGISNTFGRVVFGWISDKKFVNRLVLYAAVLTLCGLCTCASVLATNYPLLCVYSAAFGMFIGVFVSLTSVVTVDLLGLEKLTNAFGIILFFQGVGAVIGPPIAGWMFDGTGRYDASFYLMGAIIALGGIVMYPVKCIRHCQSRSSEDDELREAQMGKTVTRNENLSLA